MKLSYSFKSTYEQSHTHTCMHIYTHTQKPIYTKFFLRYAL